MTSEQWRRVEDVFEAAANRPPQERAEYLEEACGGDRQLRAEVESLLAHDEEAEGFLEAPLNPAPSTSYATSADSSESLTNQRIGAYRIVSILGSGGMGTVYLAKDERLGRMVALKLLPERLTADADRVRRFRLEARAASALNHPNILTIYDIGHTERGYYIVSEFVEGQTLRQRMQQTMGFGEILDTFAQVASALKAAHAAGIVHRDVKPENIIIRPDGYVKVLDFGVAKLTEVAQVKAAVSSPCQTLPGVLVGTPSYMSPEQVLGEPIDARSDMFALGLVLYECLAGRPAFSATNASAIFAQVISPTLPPLPSAFNPDVSPELDRIALKSLAKPVADRYQSAAEFIEDLHLVCSRLTGEQPQHRLTAAPQSSYGRMTMRFDERRDSLERVKTYSKKLTEVAGSKRRVLALLCSLGVVLLMLAIGMRTTTSVRAVESVAVLPFADEGGGGGETDYVGEGFTDSLIFNITQLQLPRFKVISRQSVLKYKGAEVDPVKVGSELDVNSIVVGKISRRNGRLRLLVELIDTRDRSQLWGAKFEGDQADILSLQGNIARKIAERLKVGTGNENDPLPSFRPSMNADAYNLYLEGRWHWNKFTPEGINQATRLYQQAIDLDPNFALAYAGLADAYVLNNLVPFRDSYMRAKAAAEKALALDASLGEARATLAFIKSHSEYDWAGAEAEFEQALKLNPNYATAHHWYASHLLALGEIERALQEMMRAKELDPLSPIINTEIGFCYLYSHRYDQAALHFSQVKVAFPDFYPAYFYLGRTYTQMGKYAEAIAEYEKALSFTEGHLVVLASLGYTYAVWGKEAEARRVISKMEATATMGGVLPYRLALVYTGLGEKDKAFALLNEAYLERDYLLVHLNADPIFDPIRHDPRFGELLRRMNLASR